MGRALSFEHCESVWRENTGGTITYDETDNTTCDPNYTYYPYPPVTSQVYWYSYPEDSTAKALRIIKVLMDRKFIKVTTVKQFIDLLDEFAKLV